MLFTIEEITQWLGITVLELFIFLVSMTTSILLTLLKLTNNLDDYSWLLILLPMFISDALNIYFCIILSVRMYLLRMARGAVMRFSWSITMLGLAFIFKFLLYKKLESPNSLEFSAVLAPIFIILQVIMIRACHIKTVYARER